MFGLPLAHVLDHAAVTSYVIPWHLVRSKCALAQFAAQKMDQHQIDLFMCGLSLKGLRAERLPQIGQQVLFGLSDALDAFWVHHAPS